MLKHEFEAATGIKVPDEQWARLGLICSAAEAVELFLDEFENPKISESETVRAMNRVMDKMEASIKDLTHVVEQERKLRKTRASELEKANEEMEQAIADKEDLETEVCYLNVAIKKLAIALIGCGMETTAVEVLGRPAVVGLKCKINFELNEADREFISCAFE